MGPLRVAIHVRGDPQRFAVRLRELAQVTDPAQRVIDPYRCPVWWITIPRNGLLFRAHGQPDERDADLVARRCLCGDGFAVARRTREIGVRVALGAQPLHVLTTVFKRPLVQLALGIGLGAVLALALASSNLPDVHLDDFGNTAAYALSTIGCCALACIVPTRRTLRIQPTEALKDEG